MLRRLIPAAAAAMMAIDVLAASAAGVRLSISAMGGNAPPSVQVTFTPVAVAGLQRGDRLVRTVTEIPGTVVLETLAPGIWMAEFDAAGYWHPPVVETVGAGGELPDIRLWPTGAVAGSLVAPAGLEVPRFVSLRVQSAPDVAAEQRVPVTEIKCPVAETTWRCEVPAGSLDLRVRTAGFQTHFAWNVRVERGATHNVGKIALRKSNSVIGFVRLGPDAKGNIEATRVSLKPAADDDTHRAHLRTETARANRRGFFRIEGLAPGDYSLSARLEDYHSPPVTIRVLEGREIELAEPLLLTPPKTLTVSITPPLAPDGRPWRLSLIAKSGPAGRSDLVTEEVAGGDGTWRRDNVPDGRYALTLKDHNGGRWHTHELDTSIDSTEMSLLVPIDVVHGTVKLGEAPLAAVLTFGGTTGAVSVAVRSNEHGEFSGQLPSAPEVVRRVTIESEAPPIRRTILNPRISESGGSLRLDLVLPSTHITGEVSGPEGVALDRVLVRVRSDEHDWQSDVEVGPDGRFDLMGQPPGWITLQASGHLMESDPVRVLARTDDSAAVHLVLKRVGLLRGRVVSLIGPVAAARVTIAPTDTDPLVIIPARTDVQGEFAALVHPGSRTANVYVDAFGLATKIFRMTIPAEKGVEIPLDQLGGTLIVDCPQFDGSDATPKPYAIHAGAERAVHLMPGIAFERVAAAGRTRLRVPLLERGVYAVCMASASDLPKLRQGALPSGRCATGFLPPLGELLIELK